MAFIEPLQAFIETLKHGRHIVNHRMEVMNITGGCSNYCHERMSETLNDDSFFSSLSRAFP